MEIALVDDMNYDRDNFLLSEYKKYRLHYIYI